MRIISPYRDIRDAIVSLMKFMKCSFEQALAHAQGQMDTVDYYTAQDPALVLPLKYEVIINEPADTIARINSFLDLNVDAQTQAAIAARFSMSEVKSRLNELQRLSTDQRDQLDSGAHAADYETITNVDGSERIFDRSSGFQSNHITTGHDGSWRSELSEQQQDVMMKAVATWLEKHEFPL